MAHQDSALTPSPITTQTFEERIIPWFKVIKKGESASIIFAPEADVNTRINHFLESVALQKKYLHDPDKCIFLLIDIELLTKEGYADSTAYIAKMLNSNKIGGLSFDGWMERLKKNNIQLVFIITNTNRIIDTNVNQLMTIIENYDFISALLFFEINITHPDLSKLLSKKSDILQNVIYYPLYAKKDTDQYIRYLAWKWELKLPDKVFNAISRECRGHTLLIKEAVRYYSNNPHTRLDSLFNHEEMDMRLEWIYILFSPSQQGILKKISLGNKKFIDYEKPDLEHLRKLSLVDSLHEITLPILEKYIRNKKHIGLGLRLDGGEVVLNEVPVRHLFSRKEYHILKNLLKRPGELISRDEISKFIWPTDTENKYSDWAIDQIIKRLRKKLTQLSIPRDVIQTYRGKGYKFEIHKYA